MFSSKPKKKFRNSNLGKRDRAALTAFGVISGFSLLAIYIGDLSPLYAIYSAALFVAVLYITTLLGRWKYLFAIPLLLLVAIEIGFRWQFGERLPIGIIESAMDTNARELTDMIWSLLPLALVALVVFIIGVYVYRFINTNRSRIVMVSMGTIIILTFINFGLMFQKHDQFISDVRAYPQTIGLYFTKINNLSLGTLIVSITHAQTKSMYTQNPDKLMPAAIHGKGNGQEIVILVMGESSLSKRYSLYGYSEKTTPNLDRLFDDSKENLADNRKKCVIPDVHSVSPITRDSVALTLSFATPSDQRAIFDEKSIINLANENGYTTYWITTQQLKGVYDTKYSFLTDESHHVRQVNPDDMLLALKLEQVLSTQKRLKENVFIVLHMTGSHMPYHNKYDELDSEALPNLGEYDRSIHKTDRVIQKITQTLQQQNRNYTMIFTSDHGEVVGAGHGLMKGGPDQFLVPLIVLSNDPEDMTCEFIESTRNDIGYVTGLSNRFTLAQLLGYELDQQRIQKDLESDLIIHADGSLHEWRNIMKSSHHGELAQ